jgi:uncharacterized GH25 family protein
MDYQDIMNVLNSADAETYMSMGRVIFGHEVWLSNPSFCKKTGICSADLLYGHNMEPDKKAPTEYVNVTVLDAGGNAIESSIEEIEKGHRITFKGNGNAPYTMYNETLPVIWNLINDGSWTAGVKRDFTNVKTSATYQMYAKMVFSEGEPTKLEQAMLEIVPDTYELAVGKKASFKVLYEGKPLCGKEMKFFSKESKEEIYDKTDANGIVSFDVNSPGDWMILMRFKDTAKAVADEFDETVFIMTLVMKAE